MSDFDDWDDDEPDENDSGECQRCHGWWGYVVGPGGELGSRYTCDCGDEVRHSGADVLRDDELLSNGTIGPGGVWACRYCGPHPQSRAGWCAVGCGRDHGGMTYSASASSSEVGRAADVRVRPNNQGDA